MTMIVRPARPADLPLIVNHYGRGDNPWDPFCDVARLEAVPRDGLIVAEVEGEYAGFLYWFEGEQPWFDPGVERYARIEEVQVLARYRRQGVGKRLLAYALNQLMNIGVDQIYIDTTEENAVAQRLYEGSGFQGFSKTVHYKLQGP